MKDDKPYEVGKGKPPKQHRWGKGQSGNPGGRKKKKQARTAMELLDQELQSIISIRENGKTVKVTKLEAVIKTMVTGALNKDPKHMAALQKAFKPLEEYWTKNGLDRSFTRVAIIDDIIMMDDPALEELVRKTIERDKENLPFSRGDIPFKDPYSR